MKDRVIEVLGRDESLIGRRDHCLVCTGLYCGLRVEELATLKVHDVDLEAGVLRVVGKGGQGAGAVHVKDGRRVEVSTRGRTEEEARALARVAEQPPEGPCVFVNANARPPSPPRRAGARHALALLRARA